MDKIHMVDLQGQYNNIKNEIDSAIQSVIDSTSFIRGPELRLFEDELAKYLGIKHVIGCANGTDALQIAMMGLGLQKGDEVITTNFTFIATVETIALLGLKPVLIDPDTDTFNISAENIKKHITTRTKAILPVHLFGQCADMDSIMALARENGIYVIEDCAQATGAEYIHSDGLKKKAGTIGDIGCTSFFPSKNLGCYGDGGALFTDNDDLASTFRSITNHGMTKKYYHDHIGVNSRLDTIQAAILRTKLKYLDRYNNARKAVADNYDRHLADIKEIILPVRHKNSDHIFHQYTIQVKNMLRDKLRTYLQSYDIPSMIYYPVPLHRQEAYKYLECPDEDFSVTSMLCERVLSLPMHTELSSDQLTYIIEKIHNFFEKE